jgi:nitrate reductase NapAB chaperone NapD
MIIASLIIKCDPSKVDEINLNISKLPNVTTHGIHKEDNLIVLIEAQNEDEIENFTRYIQAEFDGILGTYPSFISSEEQLEDNDKN